MFKKIMFLVFGVFFLNIMSVFAISPVTNISDNRSSYTSSEIPKYKKIEISFDIDTTTATNLQLPYDSTPPAGITAGIGISVDGLFLPPGELNWDSAIIQPGFWYENFSMEIVDTSSNWLYAEGKEQWKIKFAPGKTGQWKYKIRATDMSGQVESAEFTYNVVSSNSKGFIKVSKADPRYFEFENGEIFTPAGLSLVSNLYKIWDTTRQNIVVENKLNFFRPWLTAWSAIPVYGGYGSDRSTFFRYFKLALNSPDLYGNPEGVHSGRYSFRKSIDDCKDCDCWQYCTNLFINYAQPVKKFKRYKYSAWIKTINLQGDGVGARLYLDKSTLTIDSYRVKFSGDTSWTDTTIDFKLKGDNDWTKVELTFTNKDYDWIYGIGGQAWDTSRLTLPTSFTGTAYFDDLSLKEIINDSTLGPEQFDKGDMEYHEHYSQRASYNFDKMLEFAEKNGIYFKVSIEEKAEESYLRIKRDGTTDGTWKQWGDHYSEYTGYALGNSPLKWYEKAYWRYLIARWGYSTSIHSWEQFNEHDPNDTTVYKLTDEFGEYMHQNNPNKHLITTSLWSDFPATKFWGNASYPNVDYADYHSYLNPSKVGYPFWGSILTDTAVFNATIETRPEYVYGSTGYSIKIPLGRSSYDGWKYSFNVQKNGVWIIRYFMKAKNLTGTVDSNGLLKGGLYYSLDVGNNRIPNAPSKSQYSANILPGTYDWVQLSGTFEVPDNNMRDLGFYFVSEGYLAGEVWIDNLEIISPSGEKIDVNGEFDLSSKMEDDLGLYVKSKSTQLTNTGKPIVWGETGLLEGTNTDIESELLKQDTAGVGFHNIIWSQINSSGVSVLYWHHRTQIYEQPWNWIKHFKPYVQFMEGIPLNNGKYQDAKATTNNKFLRAWGQKDIVNNKAHLWIQNWQHNWRNTINKVAVDTISAGLIAIPNMNDTTYLIEWWDTYSTTGTAFGKGKARASGGNLNLSLPNSLSADVAVKVSPSSGTSSSSLDWTGEPGYTNDGVDPESGYSNASFIFRVKYTDSQNYYPFYVRLLLDKNGDGDYIDSGEVINMNEANPADKNILDGKIYTKTVTIPFTGNYTNISNKFEAYDGINFASGSPVTAINIPDLLLDLSMSISTGQVDLRDLKLSSFAQPAYITINNTSSDGSASFSLQITDNTPKENGWSAGDSSSKDVYVLKALFTGINDTPVAGDFSDDDIVTAASKIATSAIFGDTKFAVNGINVSAGTSIKLWLLFKTPQSSSLQGNTNINITVGIVGQ